MNEIQTVVKNQATQETNDIKAVVKKKNKTRPNYFIAFRILP